MTPFGAALLSSRALLKLSGADAASFLDRLVTVNVGALADCGAAYGALLTPQGKILCDFILYRDRDDFILDCAAALVEMLIARLTLYRLRAAVVLENISASYAVIAAWGETIGAFAKSFAVGDPRHAWLGTRVLLPVGEEKGLTLQAEAEWQRLRIACGIAEIGEDAGAGEVFPHDIAMDLLGGVAFDKGCYIGQEVVSRMQHRQGARRRPLIALSEGEALTPHTAITAGDRPVGMIGAAVDGTGIALVRLDRVIAARITKTPLLAGSIPLHLTLPPYAPKAWLEQDVSAEGRGEAAGGEDFTLR